MYPNPNPFFRRSHTYAYAEKSAGHSPELTSTEAAGILISVQDTASQSHEDNQPTPLAPIQEFGECVTEEDPIVVEDKVVTVKDEHGAEQLEDSTKVMSCVSL